MNESEMVEIEEFVTRLRMVRGSTYLEDAEGMIDEAADLLERLKSRALKERG